MEPINNTDIVLIDKLCNREINIEDFITRTSFKANAEQLRELLNNTRNKVTEYNDNQYFDIIFWKLPKVISKSDKVDIYREFLLKDWHHEHEEIAGAFQSFFNDDRENIPILLQAIKQVPAYLLEVNPYPYIRKIIYAIGAQPEPYNIEALKRLALSEDKEIKELALHQIDKRVELGRWEFEKNRQDGK